jgi:hypothetical protein
MFSRNQQIELFREMKIEAFLNQKIRNIKNTLDRYSESHISSATTEKEVKSLIESSGLNVPKLKKEETSTSISEEQISGYQLPSGRSFVPGKSYEIEIANYSIPFSGNKDFFKCLPKSFSQRTVIADLNQNSLTIKLTNWGKISGNDEAIEYLKTELLRNIEVIESYLTSLQKDVDEFIPELEKSLTSYIDNLKKNITVKNDSSDKLNPFK